MSLTSILLGLGTKGAARRFDVATKDPLQTQKDLMRMLIDKNAGTEYGRRYGFSSIRSFDDFQKQVPVVTYDDIREDMQRVLNGDPNILTAEAPVLFAQTSGTTGDPKYIPVTPTCQGRIHGDVMRTWMQHAYRAHRSIFSGKIVTLVSPAVEGHTPTGLPY
ncbi:unnamed protein product, partial [marine sediment metagenome]